MDINRRLLSPKLKRVGRKSSRFEVIRKSSEKTLSTIDETVARSFSSMQDFLSEEKIVTGEEEENIAGENDLHNYSFPSLEWTQDVEELVPHDQQQQEQGFPIRERGMYPRAMIREALDRRSWVESNIESAEQLGVLRSLSTTGYNKDTIHANKRVALRSRESQLRRIMYQLQVMKS